LYECKIPIVKAEHGWDGYKDLAVISLVVANDSPIHNVFSGGGQEFALSSAG